MQNIFVSLSISLTNSGKSIQRRKDLDRLECPGSAFLLPRSSVKRVDLDSFGGPSFELFKNFDHRIKLDKVKVMLSGYWIFNLSLYEKDFQDQLELMLKRELMGAMIDKSQRKD